MSSQQRIIIAIVAVLAVAGGIFWFISSNKSNTTTTNNTTKTSEGVGDIAATITYDGTSFTLSRDTVAVGTEVKVLNTSDQDLAFDSDPHPVHTDNPELNAGDIAPGKSKTFTLTEKGTWGFHNHLNAQQRGSITVE